MPTGPSSRRITATRRIVRVSLAAVLGTAAVYLIRQPDVSRLKTRNPGETAFMRLRRRQAAAKGRTLVLRQVWVPWAAISEHLRHAVLIAEDDMFYRHHGVDWEAVQLALRRDLDERTLRYGGSTITQQVAKNLFLSPSRNPLRKVKELLIARRLERELGKRRIFEIYLNVAEWGHGIFGAEAASRAYFGKSASELDADEAAAMAAVLPNPRRWNAASPTSRYVARNKRRIMRRMRASGYLPAEGIDESAVQDFFELLSSTAESRGSPPATP